MFPLNSNNLKAGSDITFGGKLLKFQASGFDAVGGYDAETIAWAISSHSKHDALPVREMQGACHGIISTCVMRAIQVFDGSGPGNAVILLVESLEILKPTSFRPIE